MLKKSETVEFDPANKDHRAAVRLFMKRRAWADSPIRFAHDPNFGSIADQVQYKLLQWYIEQEEAKLLRRQTKTAPIGDKALAFDMAGLRAYMKP